MEEFYKAEQLDLELTRRSSVKKAVYYEPEPNYYTSNLINFWLKSKP